MTIRKFMTLALATVLVWNCGGLRAAATQSPENVDTTLNTLAAELATAEQQKPVVPAEQQKEEAMPVPQASTEVAAPVMPEAVPGNGASVPAPSVPVTSNPADAANNN